MQKKKIIRFGIVILIFLIIFGIVFVINKFSNVEIPSKEEKKEEEIPYEMTLVDNYSNFFSVVNILNKYLDDIKNQETEKLLNTLHSEYILNYKINRDNIYDVLNIKSDSLQLTFKVKHMTYKTYDNFNRYLYYVKGDIIEDNFDDSKVLKEGVMFLVNIDYENITYGIYPLDYLYKVLPIINPDKPIISNTDNIVSGSNVITKEYICSLYLSDFIEKITSNVDDTYVLLDKDFRNKEYAKKSKYVNYMNNNKDKLNSQVYSCSSLSGNNHVYEVKDMNYNTYIFREKSIMNYTIEFNLK